MLQEYSIADILSTSGYIPYFVGTFEDTQDPDIEWAHRHSFYSLVWFTQGSGFYVVDFQEYEIKPQRAFIVNTKQVHNWNYSENSKGYVLMIDVVPGLELGVACPFPFVDIQEPYISMLNAVFFNLISESDIEDNMSSNNIKVGIQYLYSLIRRIAAQTQADIISHNSVMDKFRMLVFENNTKILSVEQYAEKLQMSIEELNLSCKESTGTSAKQYILDLKITEAKRLLIFSAQNINEISFQLGFEDSSYFARIFKKKTALSPTDFLKKYRKRI